MIINPFILGSAPSTLPNGLISYWKLDEASGTATDSVGSNTLTDNNTCTSAAGQVGTARQFVAAQSESLSIADNASFSAISAGMTISMWVYPDTLPNDVSMCTKWAYATDGEWVLDLNGATWQPRMVVATSSGDPGTTSGKGPGSLVALTTWTHLVWLFDGAGALNADRLKLYVNGAAQTLTFSGTIPATIRNGTAPLRIGAWSGSLTRYWNGRIDETGLWSRALTAGEVATLYNAGAGITHPF